VEEGFRASGCLEEVSVRMAFGVSGHDEDDLIRKEGSREKSLENIIKSRPFHTLFPAMFLMPPKR